MIFAIFGSTLFKRKLENVYSGKLNSSAGETLKNLGLLLRVFPFNDIFDPVFIDGIDVGARWQKFDSENVEWFENNCTGNVSKP